MPRAAVIRVVGEDGETVDFEATDLQPAGAFLHSDLMFEQGSRLAVQIDLPGFDQHVLRAEVVTVDLTGKTHGRPGMGIAFKGLAAAERHTLRLLAS